MARVWKVICRNRKLHGMPCSCQLASFGQPPFCTVHHGAVLRGLSETQEGEGAASEEGAASNEDAELAYLLAAYAAEAKALGRPHKEMQRLFLAAVSQAFDKACEALVQEHAALLATEQDNARVLNHR